MIERVTKRKAVQRPCDVCIHFKILGGRFGKCMKHESPSDPRDCVLFIGHKE